MRDMKHYILDACALIALLHDEEGANKVAAVQCCIFG
jgi:PIN domain nuclease of toxin-antitoxin system